MSTQPRQDLALLREVDLWFINRILPHAGTYLAYAKRLTRNREEAEDLVQEAYARVISNDRWRALEAPERFTLRVIHNLAVERIRQARVVTIVQAGSLEMAEWPDMTPGPYSITAARDELRRVAAALGRLPEKCREVTILRKIHELSPFQIAERLAISVSTVEKHLVKGIRLLTQILAEENKLTAEDPISECHPSDLTGNQA